MAFENITINTEDLLIFKISSESEIQECNNIEGADVGIGHDIQHNVEESRIKIDLSIIISNEADNTAKFEISTYFEISNKDKYLVEFEDELTFHPQLITTLFSIAFSTARGILFERLKKTDWRDLILPIISPLKLLQQEN